MAKVPSPDSPTEPADEPALEESFYEVPAELEEPPPLAGRRDEPEASDAEQTDRTPLRPRFPTGKVLIVLGALILIGAGLLAFRKRERDRAVRDGIARAEQLMRLDTAEAYRKAAELLTPHAQLDPLEAGSARAFALAVLAADYRDPKAEAEANSLLVVPGRAKEMPEHAALAFAVLALGRNSLGDATSALGNAHGTPWVQALEARIALRAGTLDAAVEPARGAAAEPGFVPGLSVHGDVARRASHEAETARSAYQAALAVSPNHPRSVFGLAKLALSGQAPEAAAREALTRLLGEGTPAPERWRAALHLAALRIRAGEPIPAVRQELGAGLSEKALDWLMGAARAEAANKGPYRAVTGAPPGLESASDDDPPDLRPLPPEPPPPPPPPRVEPPPAKAAAVKSVPAKAAHAGKASGKAGSKPMSGKAKSGKPAASSGKSTKKAKTTKGR